MLKIFTEHYSCPVKQEPCSSRRALQYNCAAKPRNTIAKRSYAGRSFLCRNISAATSHTHTTPQCTRIFLRPTGSTEAAACACDNFQKYSNSGCSGRNEIFSGGTLRDILECSRICCSADACTSFEYWGDGTKAHPQYGPRFCQVSSSCTGFNMDTIGGDHVKDLYVKI